MRRQRVTAALWGVLGVVALLAAWELYKFLGPAEGLVVGAVEGQAGSGVMILPRAHDRAMPHIWEMVARLFQSTSGGGRPPPYQAGPRPHAAATPRPRCSA